MLPRNDPDRIQVAFDGHRLVPNAWLILPVTSPTTWGRASWRATLLTWEMRRVGGMRETSC